MKKNQCKSSFSFRWCFIFILAISGWANAANRSFTGVLAGDQTIQFFIFTISAPQTVTLRTFSYAGGTNSSGTVIPSGGFDPILAVFDATTGAIVGQNDDGGINVPMDPVTGNRYDTYLQISLPAGNYKVAVMQYDNFAVGPNLSDGFTGTAAVGFNGRTNSWAFDALNVDSLVVVPAIVIGPAGVPTLSEWAIFMLASLMILVVMLSRKSIGKKSRVHF